MEIIRRGTAPGDRVHEAICRTCKTQIRFKQCEARVVTDNRDGDYLTIQCPVCRETITKSLVEPRPYNYQDAPAEQFYEK